MNRLTFILLAAIMLTGCSSSLPKAPELPKMPKFSMPELPKMPKLSLPSWAKPKLPSIEVYKPTIMQGSILDLEDVKELQLGMSKELVISLIGTPSVIDSFNNNEWNYINHTSSDGEVRVHYSLKLYFENNALTNIDDSNLEGLLVNN